MSAQYGPHRWSAGFHDDGHNADLCGARLEVQDLRETTLVDCDLRGARIVDGLLVGVSISGYVEGLEVNGVDVTAYVDAELDRRHPERAQLRNLAAADDFRRLWTTLGELWAHLAERAAALPDDALRERVRGEWSYLETLRHLVFITDSWARRTVLDVELPFHALALPQTAYRPDDARALGMALDADPPIADVLAARADRRAVIDGILEGLVDADLGREVRLSPAPGYPDEPRTVGECLGVVLEEEMEHRIFAARDLAILEHASAGGA